MWATILTAIALLLVIEGIVPFLSPGFWREMMLRLSTRSDRVIRIMGFISLLGGAILMFLVHTFILVD